MKKLFKDYGERPFSVGNLSEAQKKDMQKSCNLDCGLNKHKWLFNVQAFFFSYIVKKSCELHDLYYLRRGNLWDKLKGDWYFGQHMFMVINLIIWEYIRNNKALVNILVHGLVAVFFWEQLLITYLIAQGLVIAYVLAVATIGLFVFKYGEYQTWDEIKKKDFLD